MLRVTLDIFSGRPNPSWVIDGTDAEEILRALAQDPAAYSAPDPADPPLPLGLRGLILEAERDTVARDYGLPLAARIATGATRAEGRGREIAERLLAQYQPAASEQRGLAVLEVDVRALALDLLESTPRASAAPEGTPAETPSGLLDFPGECDYTQRIFEPTFWNSASVMPKNNCYNYATGLRTDTFAQPGRAAGKMYTSYTCASVGSGTKADGSRVPGVTCYPAGPGKVPLKMVLVMWPNMDFHFYCLHSGGIWGHKPGSSPARAVDQKGVVITNPLTCDRGPYTQVCGYWGTTMLTNVK